MNRPAPIELSAVPRSDPGKLGFEHRTGEGDLKELGGLYRAMPLTFVVFIVAVVSIVGVPVFNGFVSKAMVKTAAKKGHLGSLAWLFTLAGIGTTMSFVKFGYFAFFHGSADVEVADANVGQTVSMVAIAVLCILFGIYPEALFSTLPFGTGSAMPYVTGKIAEAAWITVAGVVGFRALRVPLARVTRAPDLDALYNPVCFYGLRWMVRVTGTVAERLDRAAGAVSTTGIAVAGDPQRTLSGTANAIPGIDERTGFAAGIGTSVLLIVLLTAGLLLLVL